MQLILAITFQDFVHHFTSTEGLKGIKHKKKYQIIPKHMNNNQLGETLKLFLYLNLSYDTN